MATDALPHTDMGVHRVRDAKREDLVKGDLVTEVNDPTLRGAVERVYRSRATGEPRVGVAWESTDDIVMGYATDDLRRVEELWTAAREEQDSEPAEAIRKIRAGEGTAVAFEIVRTGAYTAEENA